MTSSDTVSRQAFVATIGDANLPISYSGTPYYVLRAGQKIGLWDGGLNLSCDGVRWKSRRMAWNLLRGLAGNKPGGYQYSSSFLERLWSPVRTQIQDSVVLNCFQMFPPSIVGDESIGKVFFLDQTLEQLFKGYCAGFGGARYLPQDVLEREREGYHSAHAVIMNSQWAADSVMSTYGVPSSKVWVVPQGANVEESDYLKWENRASASRYTELKGSLDKPLRLVFVGRDWKRKGLDRLLDAVQIARLRGSRVELRVIGCEETDLPHKYQRLTGVEWMGLIDKRVDVAHFFSSVSECDVGCLLSRAEAGGISLREFHALGLAVLGPNVGGAPDNLCLQSSILVDPNESPESISRHICLLADDRELLQNLKNVAWDSRKSALWDSAAQAIQRIIS